MPFICVKTCGWIPCKLVNDKKTNKNKRLIKSQSWHDSCESISELEYFGIRMMVGINTNNNALVANASLTGNQVGQNRAVQQLSTGLRINSARDDAAGLAISTKMNSSVRGMAVAIRNVNDGISLTQIADSALASVSNSLQRMNELALQAATGTLSDGDRSKLQIEVTQLVNQIDTVSATTNFNGIRVFGGVSSKLSLQTNAASGASVALKLPFMNTRTLGLGHRSAMMAQGFGSLAVPAGSLNKGLSGGELVINGIAIGSSLPEDDTTSASDRASSAIAKVASINRQSSLTGVTARTGPTLASGVPMSTGIAGKSGTVTINGVSTATITLKGNTNLDRAQVVQAINALTPRTGVRAVDTNNSKAGVQLIAGDGRNITTYTTSLTTSSDFNAGYLGLNAVSYAAGATIGNVGIFTGTYSLQSIDDEPIVISTDHATDIPNSGLALGVYEPNRSYVNSSARQSVVADQNIPPLLSTLQGGDVPSATENATVAFGQLAGGDSVTVGGLVLTSTSPMSSSEVAAAFQNIQSGTAGAAIVVAGGKGVFSGALGSWNSGPAGGNTVKLTSVTPDTNVADLQVSNSFYAADPIKSIITPGQAATTASPGQPEIDTVRFNDLASGKSFNLLGIAVTGPMTGSAIGHLFEKQANLGGWITGNNSNGAVPFIKNTHVGSLLGTPTLATSPFYIVQNQQAGSSPTVTAPASTEVDQINFGNISQGDRVSIGGLTLTANVSMLASEVAAAFGQIADGTNAGALVVVNGKGSFTGTLTGWSTSAASGSAVQFTSTVSGPVASLAVTHTAGTGGTATVISQVTQGRLGSSNTETNTVQFGNLVSGSFVSVGGLTLTATQAMTAAEVKAVFQNLRDGVGGSALNVTGNKGYVSGTLNGWNTSLSGNSVIFTSSTANADMPDLTISYTESMASKGLEFDDMTLNGVQIPASSAADDVASNTITPSSRKEASAIAIAAAINKVSGQTGVTATPRPNVIIGGGFSFSSTNSGTLYINGQPIIIEPILDPPPDPATLGTESTLSIVTPGQVPIPASAASPEVDSIILPSLANGGTLSIAGITVTATADMTASEVQGIFANLNEGASPNSATNATITGTLTGWSTSVLGPLTIFTNSVAGPSNTHISGANIIPGELATPAIVGVNEIASIDFGQLAPGDRVTVASMTLTAVSFMTATEVAQAFSNLADGTTGNAGAKGTMSGQLTGFASSAVSGQTVTFTSSTAGPSLGNSNHFYNAVAPMTRTGQTKISNITAAINTMSGLTGVIASDNGSGLTLTAADGRNISLATGSNPATNTLTLQNLGLGPTKAAIANQQYPALKINGGPAAAITTYATVLLDSDKSFTLSGGSRSTALWDLNRLGLQENTYGGSDDGIKIADLDISSLKGTNDALASIQNALSQISDLRSNLGAMQNKLFSAVGNLRADGTNAEQSLARITDTNYSLSSTELTRSQMISQAATTMLAQANQSSQLVLQLLKP